MKIDMDLNCLHFPVHLYNSLRHYFCVYISFEDMESWIIKFCRLVPSESDFQLFEDIMLANSALRFSERSLAKSAWF